jgi:ssDNA-binding Zn-finger/Zn-ribbon topoisomerase 1
MPQPVISNLPLTDYPIEKTVQFVMSSQSDASAESLLKFLVRREQVLFRGIRNWRIEVHLRKPGYPTFVVALLEWQNAPGHTLDKARVQAVVLDLKQLIFSVDTISTQEMEIVPGLPMSTVEWYLDPSLHTDSSIFEEGVQNLLEYTIDDKKLVTAFGHGLQPLSNTWYREVREWIADHYDAQYVSRTVRTFKPTKEDGIRLCPTLPAWSPKKIKKKIKPDMMAAYTRIWERALASQMTPAVVQRTSITVSAGPKKRYVFGSIGEEILSRGFMQSLPLQSIRVRDGIHRRHGGEIKAGEHLELMKVTADLQSAAISAFDGAEVFAEFQRVEDATVEEFRANLFALQERHYIEKSQEGWRLTDKALSVEQWSSGAEKQTAAVRDHCPLCGKKLSTRLGPYGRFQSCSGYPSCRYTQALATDVACPTQQCSGHVVERQTKQGRPFYGCSRYPKCRFRSWDKPTSIVCPKCRQGNLTEKIDQNGELSLLCPQCQNAYDPAKSQLWKA